MDSFTTYIGRDGNLYRRLVQYLCIAELPYQLALDESEVVRYVLQIICDLFLRSNIMVLNRTMSGCFRCSSKKVSIIINGLNVCVILNFFIIAVGIDYRKTTKKRRIRRSLQILLQKYVQIAILRKLFTEKCVCIWMQVLRY